jgi:hypothetical protein
VFERTARLGVLSFALRGCLASKIDKAVLNNKLLFIHVPRNAGTSIATTIYGYSPAHTTAYFYRTVAQDFSKRRSPSPYCETQLIDLYPPTGSSEIEGEFARATSGIETIDQLLNFTEVNFNNFYYLDNVLRPQSWYVLGRERELLITRLFLMGEDQPKMEKFLRNFGIGEIPIKNKTKKGSLIRRRSSVSKVRQP